MLGIPAGYEKQYWQRHSSSSSFFTFSALKKGDNGDRGISRVARPAEYSSVWQSAPLSRHQQIPKCWSLPYSYFRIRISGRGLYAYNNKLLHDWLWKFLIFSTFPHGQFFRITISTRRWIHFTKRRPSDRHGPVNETHTPTQDRRSLIPWKAYESAYK